MKMIVGLGNPDRRYHRSRHNVGFDIIEAYSIERNIKLDTKKRFLSEVGEGTLDEHRFLLAKPLTHMNASGEGVRALVDFHKLKHHDVLIVHDDADMDFGKVRLTQGGNSGGHKGIESLIGQGLGDTWRLKVGVSNDQRLPGRAIDFVLREFSAAEWTVLPKLSTSLTGRLDAFVRGSVSGDTLSWL